MGTLILIILLVFIYVVVFKVARRIDKVNEARERDKFEDHWKDGYDT